MKRHPNPAEVLLSILLLVGACATSARAQGLLSAAPARVTTIDGRLAVYPPGRGDTPLYLLPPGLDHVVVSPDGRYAISCRYGRAGGLRAKDTVITTLRDGYVTRLLPLAQVLDRPKRVRTGKRSVAWGECLGFADARHLEVTTLERARTFLDVASGLWRPTLPTAVRSTPEPAVATTHGSAETYEPCARPFLLCDQFDSDTPGWRQFHGRWERDAERQVIRQRSQLEREGNALMYFGNLSIADAEIEVVLRMEVSAPQIPIVEDNRRQRRLRQIVGAGLVFRLRDEDNFYMFRLAGEQGAVLGKMVDGQWTDLDAPRAADYLNEPLRYGQFYRLRVLIEEDRIQCWITELSEEGDRILGREQAVINYQDDTFTTGYAGLVTFQIGALFDNFRVVQR